MRIAFFGLDKSDELLFQEELSDVELSFFEEKLDEQTASLAKGAEVVCVFVDSDINKAVLDALPESITLIVIMRRRRAYKFLACQHMALIQSRSLLLD